MEGAKNLPICDLCGEPYTSEGKHCYNCSIVTNLGNSDGEEARPPLKKANSKRGKSNVVYGKSNVTGSSTSSRAYRDAHGLYGNAANRKPSMVRFSSFFHFFFLFFFFLIP